MNLLMINDEVLTVETMKTDISWKQYGIDEVYTAYDVPTAKACIAEHSIDILLCDIEMPGENGIAMLRWVRENKMDTECIFLTCHASFEYAKEAIQLGCSNYILIPAKYEDIGAAVQKVVNRIVARKDILRYLEYGKQAVREKIEHATDLLGQKNVMNLVDATVSYIINNLGSESLSVNEIAEKLYVHPVYLNRIFSKERGITIGQFIIGERMKLAADLLKTNYLNANAVAELVGYKSYSNFNQMFKKYFGCSPSQYQEQQL